jgi:hypothetical protein
MLWSLLPAVRLRPHWRGIFFYGRLADTDRGLHRLAERLQGRPRGVRAALAAERAWLTNTADVAILFTHDTDLLPAVEMVARLKGARPIETASWSSRSFAQRLREVPGVHHHRISGKVFELVETPVNYAHRVS